MTGDPGRRTVGGRNSALVLLWIVVVILGMVALIRYSLGPGRGADAPPAWPAASQARRIAGQPALVMIAHPRCACTRASIEELAILMARCAGRVATTVVFIRPTATSAEWNDTDLLRSAASIPGVTVLTDPGGREAARFGAVTSGQVLLYDAAGRLRFAGGITPGRGHSGDNAGRSAVQEYLMAARSERSITPVFGCELFEPRATEPNKKTREGRK